MEPVRAAGIRGDKGRSAGCHRSPAAPASAGSAGPGAAPRHQRGSAGTAGCCRRPGERGLGFPSYICYISELYFQLYGIYF